MTDAVSNVLLFLPLGAAVAWTGVRTWRATLMGLAFSFGIEWLQSHGIPAARSAALADVITNTLGTALGAGLVAHAAWLRAPGTMAPWLARVWTAGVCGVSLLTAVAMGPRAVWVPYQQVRVALSPYTHVPGQAWYGGTNESVAVNTQHVFRKGWGGPLIVELDAEPDSLHVVSMVRGREAEPFAVPIAFVHLPNDSSPVLQMRVRGDAAEMDVTRRAWDWGMTFPGVRVPGAFAGRSLTDARPLTLDARSTRHALTLTATDGVRRETATVALTPMVGWAMLQSLVDVQSALAPAVLLAWLGVLVFPIGWWCAGAAGPPSRSWRPAHETWVPCLAVVLGVWVALAGMDWTATPTWFEVGTALVWGKVGHWAGRRWSGSGASPTSSTF